MACMQGAAREVCILPKKAGEAGALALLWKKGRDLPENVYFYILMPHFYCKVCRAQLEIRNCVRIISACNTLTQKKSVKKGNKRIGIFCLDISYVTYNNPGIRIQGRK